MERQDLVEQLPIEVWKQIARHMETKEWVRSAGGTCIALSALREAAAHRHQRAWRLQVGFHLASAHYQPAGHC